MMLFVFKREIKCFKFFQGRHRRNRPIVYKLQLGFRYDVGSGRDFTAS